MIVHTNHYARYKELLNSACDGDTAVHDCGYLAAAYILSADPEVFAWTRGNFKHQILYFSAILEAAHSSQASDAQLTAIQAAACLFDPCLVRVDLAELLTCDSFATLGIIINGIRIWCARCRPVEGKNGEMLLDASGERFQREMEGQLEKHFASRPERLTADEHTFFDINAVANNT